MKKPTMLAFENVYFAYSKVRILEGYSFSVRQNEHVVIKGVSGGGKSTVLKLILGFLKPAKGAIRFYREAKDETANIRSYTAWLPQDLNIGEGTLEEVLMHPFQFALNAPHKPEREQCLALMDRLDLASQLYEKPFRDLSTGQRQRAGLALCYLLKKPLLLLDEPSSSLDDAVKQKLADLLFGDNRTIISTSHDPFWLDRATKIYALN